MKLCKKIQSISVCLDIAKFADPNEINKKIISFFIRKLFDKTLQKSLPRANNFLGYIILSVLTQEQKLDCEEEIFEKELINALKSFNNNKSSGNDGLTKECYEAFWSELKKSFMNSISQTEIGEKNL